MHGDLLDDVDVGIEDQFQQIGPIQHDGRGGGVGLVGLEVHLGVRDRAELGVHGNPLGKGAACAGQQQTNEQQPLHSQINDGPSQR